MKVKITTVVEEQVYLDLKATAKAADVSMSEYLRRLVKENLSR